MSVLDCSCIAVCSSDMVSLSGHAAVHALSSFTATTVLLTQQGTGADSSLLLQHFCRFLLQRSLPQSASGYCAVPVSLF